MGKDVRFPIKIDGLEGLDELVTGLKKVQTAAAAANQAGATPAATNAMLARAQKANLRTQAAATSVAGVYGAGGANQYSGYKPTGVGGGMNMMGLGITAGMTAAGILLLTKWIKELALQSKISNGFLGTINKLLGLLVDVILMPFVPILVVVILGLTYAIMAFMNWWLKLNPVGGGTPGSGNTGTGPLNYLEIAAGIAGAIVGAIIGAIVGGGWGAVVGAAIGGIIATVLTGAAYQFGGYIGGLVYSAGLQFGALIVSAGAAVGGLITQIWGAWDQMVYDIKTGLDSILTSLSGKWDTFITDLTKWFAGLYDNPFIKSFLKIFGGGETTTTTIPAGQTGAGLPTPFKSESKSTQDLQFNVYGQNAVELGNQILNILRQFGVIHNG